MEIPFDELTYSIGFRSDLNKIKSFKSLSRKLYIIGDANEPNKIREAVFDGDRIGRVV